MLYNKVGWSYVHVCWSLYYRVPIDRDYSNMTERHCSQVMVHYGEKRFSNLSDVDVGPNEEIVVVDSGNKCVVVLDSELNLSTVIGQGFGNSRLVLPDGVAVKDNVIAVTDYGSNQVKKYSLQGEFLSVIGCKGAKNGQFQKPRGLSFNNNKLLYVVDKDNCRVQVFQQDDTFAFSFGNKGSGPGCLQQPIVIGIDPNNNALVSDCKANCIQHFTWLGEFIQTIKCSGSEILYTFAISPTGYLISGYRSNYKKIKIHSPTYQFMKEFGKNGSAKGEFNGIMGMAINSSGIIYVVEWNNQRLQIISDD